MDNTELHSRIFRLEMKLSDSFLKVWTVMILGFYMLTLFGLCLIHQAYTDSVREMRRELMVRSSAKPQAAPPDAHGP